MNEDSVAQPTVAHLLGEITWLLTQSPLHRAFALSDLEWFVMPALINRQFYLFRDGEGTIGLALWVKGGDEVVRKLDKGLLEPGSRLSPEDWTSGDQVWLIDLIAPFATVENRQREIMIADLISGPLQGQAFNFHQTDPQTGKRVVQRISATAGEDLRQALERELSNIK